MKVWAGRRRQGPGPGQHRMGGMALMLCWPGCGRIKADVGTRVGAQRN